MFKLKCLATRNFAGSRFQSTASTRQRLRDICHDRSFQTRLRKHLRDISEVCIHAEDRLGFAVIRHIFQVNRRIDRRDRRRRTAPVRSSASQERTHCGELKDRGLPCLPSPLRVGANGRPSNSGPFQISSEEWSYPRPTSCYA